MEIIRPARSGDCDLLAELILLSDSGLLPVLFGPDPREAIASLAAWEGNPFSYRHAWVLEAEGRVVGAALGSFPGDIKRESLSAALLIARYFRLRSPLRLLRLSHAGAATRGIDDADFYLTNIAVLPRQRGRGCGRRLLLHVELSAEESGARRMMLDVDPENLRAIAFYRRLGYSVEREIHVRIAPKLEFSYLRMGKPLNDLPDPT